MSNDIPNAAVKTDDADGAERETRGRKRWRWKTKGFLVVVILGVVCVVLWRDAVLRSLAAPLIAEGPVSEVDYLLLRESRQGVDGDRALEAVARLYHEDTSRRIVLVEPDRPRVVELGILPSFETICRRELEALDVPREAVLILAGGTSHEWEHARHVGGWLSDRPDARAVLACDRFSRARVRFILDSTLDPSTAARLRILALPDRRYDETNWWRSRCGLKSFLFGQLALAYAWCHGEDRPVSQSWDPDRYERALPKPTAEVSP